MSSSSCSTAVTGSLMLGVPARVAGRGKSSGDAWQRPPTLPRVLRMTPLLAALILAACAGGDGADVEGDGGEIAFSVNRSGWNEIWLMDADGSDRRRLTEAESPQNDAAGSMSPGWSPDGHSIAFISDRSSREEHQNEIYVMTPDGGDVRAIARNRVWDLEPASRTRPRRGQS
jgi:WD40-like Beta Propeller Repeat